MKFFCFQFYFGVCVFYFGVLCYVSFGKFCQIYLILLYRTVFTFFFSSFFFCCKSSFVLLSSVLRHFIFAKCFGNLINSPFDNSSVSNKCLELGLKYVQTLKGVTFYPAILEKTCPIQMFPRNSTLCLPSSTLLPWMYTLNYLPL